MTITYYERKSVMGIKLYKPACWFVEIKSGTRRLAYWHCSSQREAKAVVRRVQSNCPQDIRYIAS